MSSNVTAIAQGLDQMPDSVISEFKFSLRQKQTFSFVTFNLILGDDLHG